MEKSLGVYICHKFLFLIITINCNIPTTKIKKLKLPLVISVIIIWIHSHTITAFLYMERHIGYAPTSTGWKPVVITIILMPHYIYGRDGGTRIPNVLFPKQVRYQLRHTSIINRSLLEVTILCEPIKSRTFYHWIKEG